MSMNTHFYCKPYKYTTITNRAIELQTLYLCPSNHALLLGS